MANEIKYNSDELKEAEAIVKESARILQSDIQPLLSSNFEVLKELDLFSDGLNKLKTQADTLIENHNTFSTTLEAHDYDLSQLEASQAAEIEAYASSRSRSSSGGYYGGSSKKTDSISTDKVTQGEEIKDSELAEMISGLSEEDKMVVLKNIMQQEGISITSLLTDESYSNVLSCMIKRMLNDTNAEVSELPSEYEKLIQKELLESLINSNELNIQNLNFDSFLQGMPYLQQVAKSNNIEVTSLLIDDQYNGILREAIKNIYNGNSSGLTEEQINGVKIYIDNIAKGKNLDVNTLLSNDKYMSIIKGGK